MIKYLYVFVNLKIYLSRRRFPVFFFLVNHLLTSYPPWAKQNSPGDLQVCLCNRHRRFPGKLSSFNNDALGLYAIYKVIERIKIHYQTQRFDQTCVSRGLCGCVF